MYTIKLHWSKLLYSLSCLLLASWPAEAQTVTGTISGTVVDASDSAIAGATVTVISAKTGDNGGLTFTLNPATGQVTQTNPRFGQPFDALSPRVMQGSLRLSF